MTLSNKAEKHTAWPPTKSLGAVFIDEPLDSQVCYRLYLDHRGVPVTMGAGCALLRPCAHTLSFSNAHTLRRGSGLPRQVWVAHKALLHRWIFYRAGLLAFAQALQQPTVAAQRR